MGKFFKNIGHKEKSDPNSELQKYWGLFPPSHIFQRFEFISEFKSSLIQFFTIECAKTAQGASLCVLRILLLRRGSTAVFGGKWILPADARIIPEPEVHAAEETRMARDPTADRKTATMLTGEKLDFLKYF